MQLRAIKNMALLFAAMAITAVQAAAVPTGHFERTLKVNGQVDMELVSGSGNINVHVGTNDTVQINAKIHGSNNGASSPKCSVQAASRPSRCSTRRRNSGSCSLIATFSFSTCSRRGTSQLMAAERVRALLG